MPGRRNFGPILESNPSPCATCWTFASVASHRFDTALINEIFNARNAFDACLMISALFRGGQQQRRQRRLIAASRDGILARVVGAAGQGLVNLGQDLRGTLAVCAYDNPVGMQKVRHSGSLT